MRDKTGFTLLELMVAVVIMGVLAGIATPTYTRYIYRSRLTEATSFLGEVKQRQEAYRSEFGRYAAVSGSSWGTYNPTSVPGSDPVVWQTTPEWEQLGARPDGPIRFQYATVAGVPGDAVPSGSNLDNTDHWFAARGQADLDGDTQTFFLEIYSQSNHFYNSENGNKGYE